MENSELKRIFQEELWCESDLRHKKFVYRNSIVPFVCDEYVDNLDNHDHLSVKHIDGELIKGRKYLLWGNEDGLIDPTCSICNSSAFKIYYFSGLGGRERMISILRDNLKEKEDEVVNRFFKGLLYWISNEVEYRASPLEKKHKEAILKIFGEYGHKLDDSYFQQY